MLLVLFMIVTFVELIDVLLLQSKCLSFRVNSPNNCCVQNEI